LDIIIYLPLLKGGEGRFWRTGGDLAGVRCVGALLAAPVEGVA